MIAFLAVGSLSFFMGGLLVYLWRSSKIAELGARLASERETKEKMLNEFRLTAGDVLENTTRRIASDMIKDFHQVKTETDAGIEIKKSEITASVNEMKSKLEDYQRTVKKFEEERYEMYGKIERSLTQVLSAEQSLRMESASLKKVLTSSSGVRGQWGEKILREILEQNNLVHGIHFDTQVVLSEDSEAGLRPDFVIHLPGGKKMIVDSKEVAGEYVLSQDTEDPDKIKEHFAKLVTNIRNNFIRLGRKEYQSLLDPDIPFVVMFIPSEAAIRAAFATDPGIFHEATQKHVILASPMTVVPLIYLVAHSWDKQKMADNARELGAVVEVLGDRLSKFMEHLYQVRGGIQKAGESWNKAVASWKTRVSPQVEKIRSLGGKLKTFEEPEPVEPDGTFTSLPKNSDLLQ